MHAFSFELVCRVASALNLSICSNQAPIRLHTLFGATHSQAPKVFEHGMQLFSDIVRTCSNPEKTKTTVNCNDTCWRALLNEKQHCNTTITPYHANAILHSIIYSIHIYRYLASHKNSEFAKFRRFVKGRVASGTPSSQFDGVLYWKASSAWNSYGGFQCHGGIYGGTPKWIAHKVYNTMENWWNMGEHGWFGDTPRLRSF